jgi:hypothetical protein
MISRQSYLACKVVVWFVLVFLPVDVQASVTDVALKDLAAQSDLIVVARVTRVEDGPADLQPAGDEFPPVKVATAQIIETWKGDKFREIRYIASPTWPCDLASAEKGERVVLFLEGSKESPYRIAHVGRGRMPLHDADDKRYATLADEVILPKGTPTSSRTETTRVVLPTRVTGKPERLFTFEYVVRTIELGALRNLVKNDSRPSRNAPPSKP